mmetsp:Transcript_37414/g.48411  ORF Transcript_37414/g.48411 Transcript_37414/m.48411 type:complete len:349 (+) Transcript_37414:15-1061(+)
MSAVRSMMKQKGRKDVDIKALKEAKRAKLAQLAKANEMKERKLQKERELELLKSLSQPSPQPQLSQTMLPPPAKKKLPAGFFDAVKPPEPKPVTTTTTTSNLPAGFFDEPQEKEKEEKEDNKAVNEPTTGSLGGLVGYDSDDSNDSDENDENETAQSIVTTAAIIEQKKEPGSSSNLPEGFFDDANMDMKARGIEPETVAAEKKESEIEEFMTFAEKVGESAIEVEELSNNVAEESVRNASVEQALYMNRVAQMMRKVDKVEKHDSSINKLEINEKDNQSSMMTTPTPTIEVLDTIQFSVDENDNMKVKNELTALVGGRKKRRRAAERAAAMSDYVPLDPMNWRTKTI